MNELETILKKELLTVNKFIKKASEDIEKAPEGKLRVSQSNNTPQYYYKVKGTENKWKYLKKEDRELACRLAQKEYAVKVLTHMEQMKKKIMTLINCYESNPVYDLYERTSEKKQCLIKPYILTDQEYVIAWFESKKKEIDQYNLEECNKHNYSISFPKILTEKGEYVRSKSEKILADKLYKMQIPYLYEHPFYMKGYGYIKPDFTLLNRRTKKEYIWEHLGMMDNPDYVEKNIKKLESYQKNSIYPGERLLLTFETSQHPIYMKAVEEMIQKYLI